MTACPLGRVQADSGAVSALTLFIHWNYLLQHLRAACKSSLWLAWIHFTMTLHSTYLDFLVCLSNIFSRSLWKWKRGKRTFWVFKFFSFLAIDKKSSSRSEVLQLYPPHSSKNAIAIKQLLVSPSYLLVGKGKQCYVPQHGKQNIFHFRVDYYKSKY